MLKQLLAYFENVFFELSSIIEHDEDGKPAESLGVSTPLAFELVDYFCNFYFVLL